MDKVNFKEFIRNKHNIILYIILIIGAAVMLCGNITGGKNDKKDVQTSSEVMYKTDEERLCEILGDINGVGEVSVMITYYESPQKDLAYETKESENVRESSGGHEKTVDKQAVMADGNPMVVKETYPDVKGVIVTAEGAGNIKVKENISSAVQAVMNVPAHRVCVYEKNYK